MEAPIVLELSNTIRIVEFPYGNEGTLYSGPICGFFPGSLGFVCGPSITISVSYHSYPPPTWESQPHGNNLAGVPGALRGEVVTDKHLQS